MTAIIVGVVLVIIFLYIMSVYNKVKKSAVDVDNAFAGIETYLEERFDALTKVISTAKEEARLEIEMQTGIAKTRSAFDNAKSVDEKVDIANKFEQELPNFLVTMENYPDPQFNEAFRTVQRSILVIEDKLSAARRNFNAHVGIFNKHIVTFPAVMIAGMFGFKEKKMFEATAHKRDDIDIDSMWG